MKRPGAADDAAVAQGRREPRETCWRCRRPKASCLCPSRPPMETRTRIVILMHPQEYRSIKCNTGRLTCLNLANSEIIQGIGFDDDPRVRALLGDPSSFPVLLYPGPGAVNVSTEGLGGLPVGNRRLTVFLLDATWSCAGKMFRRSQALQRLPRLMITPTAPSRFFIKHQPRKECLSTLEAAHELLSSLEAAGLDSYPDKGRLLDVFAAMQNYQVARTTGAGRALRGVR